MRQVATSWKLIEAVLWEHAHSVSRSLRPPASDRQIELLKRKLPVSLPRTLEQSLRIHDGMRSQFRGRQIDLVDGWLMSSAAEIASNWQMMWDLRCECGFGGDQVTTTRALKNNMHWRAGWIPVLDENGNRIVIDMDPGSKGRVGQVFRWFNYGHVPMKVVAESWGAWLDKMAEELHARRFKLNEFGAIWLLQDAIT